MIDPNIPLQVKTVAPLDPLEAAGKAMQLAAARQQLAMMPYHVAQAQMQLQQLQMENQQRQQAILDDQRARDFFAKNPNASAEDMITALGPKVAHPLIKSMYESQKANLEMGAERAKQWGQIAGGITDEPSFQRGVGDALARKLIDVPTAASLLHQGWNDQTAAQVKQIQQQAMTTAEQHTAALADLEERRKALLFPSQLKESQAKAATAQRTNAISELNAIPNNDAAAYQKWAAAHPELNPPAEYSPEYVARVNRSGVPAEKLPAYDVDKMKAAMGLMGNSEYDQFLLGYAQKLGKTPASLTPDERLASFGQFAELKQDPQMRAAALAQKNLADVMKRIQLDQMPTQADAKRFADDIVNHRLAPSQLSEIRGRGNGALGMMIARELPPGYNWEQADSEYNLVKSPQFQQTVRYMDYVGSSVDRVITAAQRLNNGKIRSLNAVKNWTADQLNGVDIARFQTDRIEVADAIAKILQGGGTGSGTSDMKLKQAENLIRETDDPAVVRVKMQEIKDLIGTRRSTLTKGTYLENAQPSGENPAGSIRVKRKSDGATGTLDPKDFDPAKYEKL